MFFHPIYSSFLEITIFSSETLILQYVIKKERHRKCKDFFGSKKKKQKAKRQDVFCIFYRKYDVCDFSFFRFGNREIWIFMQEKKSFELEIRVGKIV